MSFDELLRRLQQRLAEHQQTGRSELILSDAVQAESDELWQAVRPSDPEHPTAEDNQRRGAAHHVLGWLFFLRYRALPGPDLRQLARAIWFLAPLAHDPDLLPGPLHAVLGPGADPLTQTDLANSLAQEAMTDTDDPALLDMAIALFTAAAATPSSETFDQVAAMANLGGLHRLRSERGAEAAELERAVELGEQALTAATADHPQRAGMLVNLSGTYRHRFGRGGSAADLDRAVELAAQAVAVTSTGHPQREQALTILRDSYESMFEHTGAVEDLERLVKADEQLLAVLPDEHPQRAQRLLKAAADYGSLFDHTDAAADLDRATELGERALAAASAGHPHRLGFLVGLSSTYFRRFDRTNAWEDLQRVIELGEQFLAAIPAEDSGSVGMLAGLSAAYRWRFERTSAAEDLERAIRLGEGAVASAPAGHPDLSVALTTLGAALQQRHDRSHAMEDLERVIELAEQALAGIATDDPHRGATLSSLSAAHRSRYERTGTLADLERAIELGEQVLGTIAPGHRRRAAALHGLSRTYRARFERQPTAEDLDRVVELGEQALAVESTDDARRAEMQYELGESYRARFERTGVVADIDRAIQLGEQALTHVAADRPEQARIRSNLGLDYLSRFERTGTLADLERAIELTGQAIAALPADDPDRVAMLANLATNHRSRFKRTGVVADIDRAIQLGEQVLAMASEQEPRRSGLLSGLGSSYRSRFERTGVVADIDRAIQLGEQALATDPGAQPNPAGHLHDLGISYLRRFDHSGMVADLNRAAELGEHAVARDDTDRADHLSTLCGVYVQRFQRLGAVTDLERALELGERAVTATPVDHAQRPGRMSNLGTAYRVSYDRSGVAADLGRAIELGELAAASCDDTFRAGVLLNVSASYHARFDAQGAVADLERSIELDEQAVATAGDDTQRILSLIGLVQEYMTRLTSTGRGVDRATLQALAARVLSATTASPANRARAAADSGWLAQVLGEHSIALELFDSAVAMLPLLAPREAGWADQEHHLGLFPGLVGEAVAARCAIGDVTGAVQAAEMGRGVLLAAQLDARTDLTDLQQAHPELAALFRSARDSLSFPSSGASGDVTSVAEIEARKRLWAEHDELLGRIRRQSGFTRFLLPPRLADLRRAAADGTVVLVNVGQRRGDAIIITNATDPVHIPLPGLVRGDVESHAQELLEVTHDSSPLAGTLRRNRVLSGVLAWLWDAIVEPVLAALPSTTGNAGAVPRVWWLPVGLLGQFPLHAAGRPGQPGALDKAVSSYTPTLRALAHSRTRPATSARRQLTIALAHTPGLTDLPGTAAEAAALHTHHPGTPLLADQDATAGRVLAALAEATWAHFACHASADPATPCRSGLHLHDATLPLPDISRLDLPNAELAYLSACSTAQTGRRHADERLHLASAFQLAGYRHVIASLWPLNDHIAAAAATAFYQQLPDGPSADGACVALREVVRELRAEHPDRPDLWAALIHSGP